MINSGILVFPNKSKFLHDRNVELDCLWRDYKIINLLFIKVLILASDQLGFPA